MLLKNSLLIAMPVMNDSLFAKKVVYICEHNQEGTFGLIINQPLVYQLSFIFEQLHIEEFDKVMGEKQLLFGGPLQQERGFVIFKPYKTMPNSLNLSPDFSISTNKKILQHLAHHEGPNSSLVVLGYAGWGPDQIEQEIINNFWLTCPATPQLVYDTPFEKRWRQAGLELGVDLNTLTSGAGHD